MRPWEVVIALIGGLAGGGAVAVFQYFQVDRVAQDASYVSIVQSRVAACFAITDHHRLQYQRDQDEVERTGLPIEPVELSLLDEQGLVVERVSQSTNFERFVRSVRMGRELDLCLALSTDMDELRNCVASATHDQPGKRVFDDLGLSDADRNRIGRSNPAC